MGDVYAKVRICGVRADGKRGRSLTVDALLDTGATASVIRASLADAVRGTRLPRFDEVEGKKRDVMWARIQALALDCGVRGRPVIVDDALVDRAGPGPDGKPLQMILGHDYMQRTRMILLLSTKKSDEGIACRKGKPPRGSRRVRA
jgi:hypothetical protein